ncbi:MAG: hypothetical protein COZ20_03650 [Gallionellales bacterium CG_4_10_14_3_um_filter_54_96]|nr:MAG: hypothetical protein COZ20_03650 [Gallionellales bacterium CG_4_10_14_3_um_filter_54_96]
MEYFKANTRVSYLLLALSCLSVASQASAGEGKNLSPEQQMLTPQDNLVVPAPAAKKSLISPRVAAASGKAAATKPRSPAAMLAPALAPSTPARHAIKHKTLTIGGRGLLSGSRPESRQAPATQSRAMPSLPSVPVHRPPALAPARLNPLGGGLAPVAPAGRHSTGSATLRGAATAPAAARVTGGQSGFAPAQRGIGRSSGGGSAGVDNGRKTHGFSAPKPVGDGSVSYSNGDIVRGENNGSKTTRHVDGSTETFDPNGGTLQTGADIKVSPAADGGTDVDDTKTGTSAHFGGGHVEHDPGDDKYNRSGDMQAPDGSYSFTDSNGSTNIRHPDGSSEVWQSDGNYLETGPGMKTNATPDGGTEVIDPSGGVTAHFGGGRIENDPSADKFDGSGDMQAPDGSHSFTDSNGSITVRNTDGTSNVWQSDGSYLETGAGMKTNATPDGGTEVIDPSGGVTAHFGGGQSSTEQSEAKYIGGGTVQEPDGDKHPGKKPQSDNSSSADDDSDSGSSASSDDSSSDSDSSADSGDDNTDDDNSADSSDSSSDDSASKDDDSSSDDGSSDEARAGFEGGSGSDGGPRATTVVDDRVARMKGEKRAPESPDDAEPGNGGAAPDSVSQPGPKGGHRGSPLARPSAAGHQSPVAGVVVSPVKSRAAVGGGDCFDSAGCDNAAVGGFKMDPLDRAPVTNPGDH